MRCYQVMMNGKDIRSQGVSSISLGAPATACCWNTVSSLSPLDHRIIHKFSLEVAMERFIFGTCSLALRILSRSLRYSSGSCFTPASRWNRCHVYQHKDKPVHGWQHRRRRWPVRHSFSWLCCTCVISLARR